MLSQIPLGLQFALETVLEEVPWERVSEERIIPDRSRVPESKIFMVDLFTLVKEIIDEVEKPEHNSRVFSMVIERLNLVVEELDNIDQLNGILVFTNSLSFLKSIPKKSVRIFKDNTKVKLKFEILMSVMKQIKFSKRNYQQTTGSYPTLVYTHNNVFLTMHYKLGKKLLVLENHTGLILDKKELSKRFKSSTKYDKHTIPFTFTNLMVFGDKYLVGGNNEIEEMFLTTFKETKRYPEGPKIDLLIKK